MKIPDELEAELSKNQTEFMAKYEAMIARWETEKPDRLEVAKEVAGMCARLSDMPQGIALSLFAPNGLRLVFQALKVTLEITLELVEAALKWEEEKPKGVNGVSK